MPDRGIQDKHQPSGQFEVKSANGTIYINDGSNVTVTLAAASDVTVIYQV